MSTSHDIILGICVTQNKDPKLGSESIAKLLKVVDEWIPTPIRDLDKPFLLPVEHVYSIAGRGTVVTGRIERGKIQKGQDIEIVGENANIKTKVTGKYDLAYIDIPLVQNFDRGNFAVFDAFQPDCQNLTNQIFKVLQHLCRSIVKDGDHPLKYFPSKVIKILPYTVTANSTY